MNSNEHSFVLTSRKNSINELNDDDNDNDNEYICCHIKKKIKVDYSNSSSNNTLENFTSSEDFYRSRSSSLVNSYSPSQLKQQTLRNNKIFYFGKDNKDLNDYIVHEIINKNEKNNEQIIEQKITAAATTATTITTKNNFCYNSFINNSNNNDTDDEDGWGFYA